MEFFDSKLDVKFLEDVEDDILNIGLFLHNNGYFFKNKIEQIKV
jgi:hypothetical protein